MKSKKITIISSYFAPAWAYGGPPKVLFNLAKALINLNIEVGVITTDSLGNIRSDKFYEKMHGIEVYRFKNLSNSLAYTEKLFYAPAVLQKAKEILADADRVLFSDVRSIFNWQLYRYVVRERIPYGVFAFGQIPYGTGFKSLIKKVFDIIWVKDFIKNASYHFAQTEHEQEMYELFFGVSKSKVKLLPLPVDTNISKPNLHGVERFRNKYNLTKKHIVILYVGRINYLKGIDLLIHAVTNLLRGDINLKLLIVGRDDGYLSSLVSIVPDDIKKQIIFSGPLYGNDVGMIYTCSSCFAITPRFYEETSTAALEALSNGLPIVATKEADIPHFTGYRAGFIVENTKQNISRAVKKIIYSTDKEKKLMSVEARKCIQDHFLAINVAKHLLNILFE